LFTLNDLTHSIFLLVLLLTNLHVFKLQSLYVLFIFDFHSKIHLFFSFHLKPFHIRMKPPIFISLLYYALLYNILFIKDVYCKQRFVLIMIVECFKYFE